MTDRETIVEENLPARKEPSSRIVPSNKPPLYLPSHVSRFLSTDLAPLLPSAFFPLDFSIHNQKDSRFARAGNSSTLTFNRHPAISRLRVSRGGGSTVGRVASTPLSIRPCLSLLLSLFVSLFLSSLSLSWGTPWKTAKDVVFNDFRERYENHKPSGRRSKKKQKR